MEGGGQEEIPVHDRAARLLAVTNDLALRARRALVTGGTQGIGAAVVARLRELGARVLPTARATPAKLADANLFVAADIATAEGCATVVDAVRDRLDGVDIIVHVVGGSSAPAGRLPGPPGKKWQPPPPPNPFPPGPPCLALFSRVPARGARATL